MILIGIGICSGNINPENAVLDLLHLVNRQSPPMSGHRIFCTGRDARFRRASRTRHIVKFLFQCAAKIVNVCATVKQLDHSNVSHLQGIKKARISLDCLHHERLPRHGDNGKEVDFIGPVII